MSRLRGLGVSGRNCAGWQLGTLQARYRGRGARARRARRRARLLCGAFIRERGMSLLRRGGGAPEVSLGLGADGGVDAEVGLHGVALGVEDVERIGDAGGEAEVVELDVRGGVAVYAADVDRQLLVDEYPDVVVTGECEGLAAGVLECGVDLGREVEVVLP